MIPGVAFVAVVAEAWMAAIIVKIEDWSWVVLVAFVVDSGFGECFCGGFCGGTGPGYGHGFVVEWGMWALVGVGKWAYLFCVLIAGG